MNTTSKKRRIAIVGVGAVGSTLAYTLLMNQRAEELVLIDINHEKATADALDLFHCIPFMSNTKIWAGNYSDCSTADIIVITAGAAQAPGETRLDLLQRNTIIFEKILIEIKKYTETAILLLVANPVDIMSYISLQLTGFPANQIIGSGTVLDTARFKAIIGQSLDIDSRSIKANIIGEHGDSAVPLWSSVTAEGTPIQFTEEEKEKIYQDTKDAAYQIIKGKGATFYAVAQACDQICTAILRNERSILNVSTLLSDYHGISDVYLGVPAIVDGSGVSSILEVEMTDAELKQLQSSAQILKEQYAQLVGKKGTL